MPTSISEIKTAIDSFDLDKARALLKDALKEPNAEVYYLASLVALDDKQKTDFLRKTLELDPFHDKAYSALKSFQLDSPKLDKVKPVNDEIAKQIVTQEQKVIKYETYIQEQERTLQQFGPIAVLGFVLWIGAFLIFFVWGTDGGLIGSIFLLIGTGLLLAGVGRRNVANTNLNGAKTDLAEIQAKIIELKSL